METKKLVLFVLLGLFCFSISLQTIPFSSLTITEWEGRPVSKVLDSISLKRKQLHLRILMLAPKSFGDMVLFELTVRKGVRESTQVFQNLDTARDPNLDRRNIEACVRNVGAESTDDIEFIAREIERAAVFENDGTFEGRVIPSNPPKTSLSWELNELSLCFIVAWLCGNIVGLCIMRIVKIPWAR